MTTFKKLKYDSNLKPNNRLREIRLSKDLTLKKVADDIGISENLIGKYEREEREPKLKTWIKLADYFNVSVSYLQGLTGFSKGKAPSDEIDTSEDKTSDDIDINYLHQRIRRMLEIDNLAELQNELKQVTELITLMNR
ncbi:helix-turn-helix domain-containing protein [Ligilactobacillus salivarius]|uniref:helix-turn-helix domain-containing protein n=1 Tax=Ligilactobacillus salivarius TaxID=1624 RepID=UPI00136AB466|nr:helix-turn-helix transcriptional regulator [Ligilactobacillus salivarius]MYY22237.1 helix-turn-helix transcriptional regulator [Ligilactobacillus salivarius]MYY39291.1 helix-turn-helix transcriptional regulator [Ligilactobacillus salivarius]